VLLSEQVTIKITYLDTMSYFKHCYSSMYKGSTTKQNHPLEFIISVDYSSEIFHVKTHLI